MEIQETDKMTAWEELSGPRYVQPKTSDLLIAEARAAPCPPLEAMRLLGKNLTLCSPAGMNEDDRAEWIKEALEAIGDVPQDLLEAACKKAKQQCDHPAKIVPFICRETAELTKFRQEALRHAQKQAENANAPKLEKKPFELDDSDRKGLAADIGALARELERKARMSETN